MSNILKNSWTLFTRNKEYFRSIVLTPVMMLLIFSFILAFQSKVNIAFIDLDGGEFGEMIEETLDNMDFIKTVSVREDAVEEYIRNGKIDLAVIVTKGASGADLSQTKPVQIIKAQDSELADYMEAILNAQIDIYQSGAASRFSVMQNDVAEKGVPITNALGVVIFKMLGCASLLAGLIIMELKNGIRDRIYMSKTKLSVYLAGRGAVFFVHLLLFSVVYFLAAKLFRFDFAMKYPAQILIIFVVLSIFTTAFGLLLSAFAKDDGAVWSFGVMVLLPTSILSGALFPFESMPKPLRMVGSVFPQRWIARAVELLQEGGGVTDIVLPLTGVLILSVVFFVIASVRLGRGRR